MKFSFTYEGEKDVGIANLSIWLSDFSKNENNINRLRKEKTIEAVGKNFKIALTLED